VRILEHSATCSVSADASRVAATSSITAWNK